jgi:Domain of unknown function (DUF1905)/Bacteriocin-protection, YdeI or OmpD-Associated
MSTSFGSADVSSLIGDAIRELLIWLMSVAQSSGADFLLDLHFSPQTPFRLAPTRPRAYSLCASSPAEWCSMKKIEFTVKLEGKEGSSVAWLNAPFDVVKVFGTRARVPVRGTINGFPFRSSLMPMGGCHGMAVNKTMRDGAGVGAGDTVSVVMERDESERIVEVPTLLKKELAKSKTAQANWQKLSFTNQKEIALSIREAKQEETRARRLAKAMDILKTGKKWTG